MHLIQAALKSLKSPMVSSKIVKECLDLLEDLTSYFTINLQWVPGHSDIPGNCEAEELARTGTTLQLTPEKGYFYASGNMQAPNKRTCYKSSWVSLNNLLNQQTNVAGMERESHKDY